MRRVDIPSTTLRLAVGLALVGLLSGQSPTPPANPPAEAGPSAADEKRRLERLSAQTELEALITAILTRVLNEPDYLPGRGFRGEPPYRLESQVGGHGVVIAPRLLPAPEKWTLGMKQEFDAAAARGTDPVSYVTIQKMTVEGTKATVEVGYDIAVPPKFMKLCCCISTDAWEKKPKVGWTFVKRLETWCS